ncbi:MAG TPA: aromatic ring-hydroxylating dioxygenase subunit alpha [Chloroflexota bacterium]|nr:aromatic ring-hydroxylating dioxygenase subunit alpha [Chloroflexota bacterium]
MQATTDSASDSGNGAVSDNGRGANGHGNGNEPVPNNQRSRDLRQLLPVLGLREYWYPALRESKVGWRRPVLVKMLGQDVCFFRGKSGQVVAVDNACPHRGAMLHKGHCDFKGTLACFYHGFVFDETGLCVAALGEGPLSPMPGKLRVKSYPTITLKGIVFAWMGVGEPVPPETDIPEDFFDPTVKIFSWTNSWPSNWRPAVENYADSHVRYVHRNSALMLMHKIMPATLPMAGKPYRVGPHRLAASGRRAVGQPPIANGPNRPYQDYFPLLGARWPKTKYRFAWTWIFDLGARVRARFRPVYDVSEEWGTGQHLPSVVRLNYGTHMYTRWCIPVSENVTRMVYFHASRRSTLLGRIHEAIQWTAFHNWAMNKNFSEQDSPGAIHLYYDRPERLSVSDQQTIEWRKMLLSARGMPKSGAQPRAASASYLVTR